MVLHQLDGRDPNTAAPAYGDQPNGAGVCGHGTPLGTAAGVPIEGRCGYGPRLPLIVISPFAKANFVNNTLTDQSALLRFIEDNRGTGRIGGGSFDVDAGPLTDMFGFSGHRSDRRPLLLDPTTGEPQER